MNMRAFIIEVLSRVVLISFFTSGCGYTVLETTSDPGARAKAQRTMQEDKLQSELRTLLILAEKADTSEQSRQELAHAVQQKADGSAVVSVELTLDDISAIGPVEAKLSSLGATFTEYKDLPIVSCSVRPKDLRYLISIDSILAIKTAGHGGWRR